jgi:hypothetical protein
MSIVSYLINHKISKKTIMITNTYIRMNKKLKSNRFLLKLPILFPKDVFAEKTKQNCLSTFEHILKSASKKEFDSSVKKSR